ncbi:MAG TPA: thioredoxin TrxC [Thauera sp.]|jgi:thioredoxin 2|nr:thioredoxin TrxC [Thauera sp.]HRA80727.1 thioredoxin TrxC [Thauera sp.]
MSDALHLVCPHCDAVNRVPASRLAEAPVCGKCRQALFTAHALELTSANFDRHIGRNEIPVLVDFWAPWCGPCRTMAPAFTEAAGLLEPKLRLVKLNTEAEQAIAARFGIRSIPTLALFRGGREVARQAGAMGAADIVRWVRSHQA